MAESQGVREAAAVVGVKREAETQLSVVDATAAEPPTCWKCSSLDVKYRCPRCECVTCSLACCIEHKRVNDCNGKRDRTKFVQIKQFSDATLSNDYFFLEELARSTSTASRMRDQLGLNARRSAPTANGKKRKVQASSKRAVNPHVPSDWLARFPKSVQVLHQHAAKRGVALTLLAPGMSKRAANTSYMDIKAQTLFWRVEWSFPSSEVPVKLLEERASDANTPFELLGAYLNKSPDNAGIRGKLKKYATSDWQQQIVLLLRQEFTKTSEPHYYRLDGSLSLESNLKRKAVVEFPVIIVALKEEAEKYPQAYDVIEVVSAQEDEEEGAEEQAQAPPQEQELSMITEPQVLESVMEEEELEEEQEMEAVPEEELDQAQVMMETEDLLMKEGNQIEELEGTGLLLESELGSDLLLDEIMGDADDDCPIEIDLN